MIQILHILLFNSQQSLFIIIVSVNSRVDPPVRNGTGGLWTSIKNRFSKFERKNFRYASTKHFHVFWFLKWIFSIDNVLSSYFFLKSTFLQGQRYTTLIFFTPRIFQCFNFFYRKNVSFSYKALCESDQWLYSLHTNSYSKRLYSDSFSATVLFRTALHIIYIKIISFFPPKCFGWNLAFLYWCPERDIHHWK